MKLTIINLFFIFLANNCFASKLDGKTVSFNDIINAMISDEVDQYSKTSVGSPVSFYSKNGFIIFNNCNIIFDREKDNPWDERFAKGGKKISIKKGIDFRDCTFPDLYWFVLRDFIFEGPVCFRGVKGIQLFLRNCDFLHNFSVLNTELGFANFEKTNFNLGFQIADNVIIKDHLTITDCKFSFNENFYKNPDIVKHQNILGNLVVMPDYFHISNRNNPFFLNILNSEFKVPKSLENNDQITLDVSNSVFNGLSISKCNFNIPINFSFVTVANQFKFTEIQTKSLFLAEAISFNPANSKLDWSQISGRKIAIKGNNGELISGQMASSIENENYFNTLISVYALLYSSYKNQGNKISSNASYIEWKDIETDYLAHVLTQKNDLNTWFLWVMNLFLKTFCDYGTSPLKSMSWSFFVMFCFGMVYLFFPNSTNLSNEFSYYDRIKKLMEYFTENKRLTDCLLGTSFYNARIRNPEIVYKEIKRNSSILPFYFRIFASPPGRIIRLFHYFKLKLLRKSDQFAGRWNEISKTKKKVIYIIYGILMFFSLSYLILIKFLNAMMLSLNAFSTLGFGDVPVQGIAKYLTIIEGFVGWFLLSIFSVALLSQIIQ